MNMAYNNRFVITVLQNDRIIKELANGSVSMEFGEYKIRLRNKHNRRAICRLSIDGENVSAGGFIIPANSFIDIERSADVAKKFKFVSLESEEAQDFGKNGTNHDKIKGTIVAEFALEKEYTYNPLVVPNYVTHNHYHYPKFVGASSVNSFTYGADCLKSHDGVSCSYTSTVTTGGTGSYARALSRLGETQNLQDGATVEGSHSGQTFSTTHFTHEDNWTSIRIFLQGYEKKKNSFKSDYPEIWKAIKLGYITQDSLKEYDKNQSENEKITSKSYQKDEELIALENELLELQKQKIRREIDKIKEDLA